MSSLPLLFPGSRVAVVGSRSFSAPECVSSFVRALPAGVCVVSGAGGVVDLTAAAAARECGLSVLEFPARWAEFGRAAGPLRNRELAWCGLACLVAFVEDPARPSAGTASALREARAAGVPCFVFGPQYQAAA